MPMGLYDLAASKNAPDSLKIEAKALFDEGLNSLKVFFGQ